MSYIENQELPDAVRVIKRVASERVAMRESVDNETAQLLARGLVSLTADKDFVMTIYGGCNPDGRKKIALKLAGGRMENFSAEEKKDRLMESVYLVIAKKKQQMTCEIIGRREFDLKLYELGYYPTDDEEDKIYEFVNENWEADKVKIRVDKKTRGVEVVLERYLDVEKLVNSHSSRLREMLEVIKKHMRIPDFDAPGL